MKYICPLIVVENIQTSRKFYETVMNQKVKYDFGENVQFEGDFAIHDKKHYQQLIAQDSFNILRRSNNFELYFEDDDIENAVCRVKKSNAAFIHDIREQPWGQRAARFYDPDGYIIEIGESMEAVAMRYFQGGMSVREIAKKTSLPFEFVESTLTQRIPGYNDKNQER